MFLRGSFARNHNLGLFTASIHPILLRRAPRSGPAAQLRTQRPAGALASQTALGSKPDRMSFRNHSVSAELSCRYTRSGVVHLLRVHCTGSAKIATAAAGTEAAATEQGGPSVMQRFHESQRQVARLSVPEEARLIVELGRWAPNTHLTCPFTMYRNHPVRGPPLFHTTACTSAPLQARLRNAAQMTLTLDPHCGSAPLCIFRYTKQYRRMWHQKTI